MVFPAHFLRSGAVACTMPDAGLRGPVNVGVSNNGVEMVWSPHQFHYPSFCDPHTQIQLEGEDEMELVDGSGEGTYENDLDCEWLITAAPSDRETVGVEIRFVEFETEWGGDWLQVFSGGGGGEVGPSPALYNLTGTEAEGKVVLIPGPELRLRFVTDGMGRRSGFKLEVSLVLEELEPTVPCTSQHWESVVGVCGVGSERRPVTYHWLQPKTCNVGDLPPELNIECDTVPWGSTTSHVVTAVAVVGAATATLFIAFLRRYRLRAAVKSAQIPFCVLYCVGAALMCVWRLAFVGPVTAERCMLRQWLFAPSTTLLFGPLIMKLKRVLEIVTNRSMRKVGARDRQLYRHLLLLLAVDVVVLSLWSALNPLEAVVRMREEAGVGAVPYWECDTDNHRDMITLIQAYKACLVVYSTYLAFQARSVSSLFSESKYIMLAVYNGAFVGGISVLLAATMELTLRTDVLLKTLATGWTCVVSLNLVFVPKMIMVNASTAPLETESENFTGMGLTVNASRALSGPSPTSPPPGNDGSEANELLVENERLRRRLEDQDCQIQILRKRLSSHRSRSDVSLPLSARFQRSREAGVEGGVEAGSSGIDAEYGGARVVRVAAPDEASLAPTEASSTDPDRNHRDFNNYNRDHYPGLYNSRDRRGEDDRVMDQIEEDENRQGGGGGEETGDLPGLPSSVISGVPTSTEALVISRDEHNLGSDVRLQIDGD